MRKNNLVTLLVFVVLFCTYIFPLGLVDPTYVLSKLIFISFVGIYYLINFKVVSIYELFFLALLAILTIVLKDINYALFISIPFLNRFLKYEKSIVEYLNHSVILYICLFFTIIYSLIFFGEQGRFAFSAIKEINQSGLAIFCLGTMLLKKDKKVGLFALTFGILTFSRSYILALILLILSKKIKHIKPKIIKWTNYFNLTVISSVIFAILGIYFVNQYKLGNIYYSGELSDKFINFLDYSNMFRFSAILKIILIFYFNPFKLLTGISDYEYTAIGNKIAKSLGIPGNNIVPHNLFFSHLKIYGLIAILETILVSKILSKIVTEKNYFIFIAIVLYSLILGAGLYSYWLYLSCFVLLMHKGEDYENINNR